MTAHQPPPDLDDAVLVRIDCRNGHPTALMSEWHLGKALFYCADEACGETWVGDVVEPPCTFCRTSNEDRAHCTECDTTGCTAPPCELEHWGVCPDARNLWREGRS